MQKWRKGVIADLGRVVTGKTPSTKNNEFWSGNWHFITPKDLQGEKRIFKTERFVTDEGLKCVKGAILPPNAVCVSCIGNIGYVGMTTRRCVSNQQINSIVASETNDPHFIYYLMRNLWKFFKNYEGQSTVVSILNKTQFSKIEIQIPDAETQRKIAAILSALDDKIELNRRINTNLEEQATAIYAKFFPYETTDALPEGWRVGTVGEIVEIHDSKRVPLSAAERMKMENKKFPYYGAASLMDYVEDYIFDGKYLLLGEDGTVVDAKGGPILQYVWGKFWVNNHAHVLTGKLGFNVESLMLLFKQTYVKPIVTGAVQPKISQANLRSLPIIVPPMERLNYFNDKVASLFTQYRVNEEQNKVLTTVRDALLPRLMSGEIDVSDVSL